MYKTMNHPSEWAKFVDERAGRYRYKHKGSGLVRDTLMAIGKTLRKGTTNVAKKVVRSSAEKAVKKLSEAVVEKGSDKIQRILQKRRPKTPTPKPTLRAPSKTPARESASQVAMIKLTKILANERISINIRNDVRNPPLCREDRIHPVQP